MSGELLSRRPIDGLTEREIDLLLLMTLHASSGFRTFLASRIAGPGAFEFLGLGAACTTISACATC